jgi:hypothetical protein
MAGLECVKRTRRTDASKSPTLFFRRHFFAPCSRHKIASARLSRYSFQILSRASRPCQRRDVVVIYSIAIFRKCDVHHNISIHLCFLLQQRRLISLSPQSPSSITGQKCCHHLSRCDNPAAIKGQKRTSRTIHRIVERFQSVGGTKNRSVVQTSKREQITVF